MAPTRILVAFLISTSWLMASQYAVLQNGFRISAQSIEKLEDRYVLTIDTGTIVLTAAQVASIEQDDYVSPPSPQVKGIEPAAAEQQPPTRPIPQILTEAANRHGLPPTFVRAVAKAESALNPAAVSRAGAIGVMQLMPATAAALNADPKDPEQNIEAGTRYLRELLIKYNGDAVKALAAYNAGSGAVDRFNGVPPYQETVNYVDRVIRDYRRTQ